MRFIHTADLHLGNQMHNIDRTAETSAFFDWLKLQIVREEAQALIISGDIFDNANPSIEARTQFYTFLASLTETKCKNIILVGGNHDSGAMLDSTKKIFELLNIHVIGSIANLSPSDMVFELFDEKKNCIGICLAVPFVRDIELRNFLQAKGIKSSDSDLLSAGYTKLYSEVFAAAEKIRAQRNLPLIATGHLYANDLEGRLKNANASVKTDDGVRVLDVLGTLGNVPQTVFPPVHYVALGHIHYSTTVAKNERIRYSGSPFVLGFDEASLPHHILLVDLKEENSFSPIVKKIQTEAHFVYKRISGSLPEIKSELQKLSLLKGQDGVKPIFIEISYKKDFSQSIKQTAQDFLEEEIKNLPSECSVVSWRVQESESYNYSEMQNFDAQEIENLDEETIFTKFILSRIKYAPESEEAKEILKVCLPLFLEVAGDVL